MAEKKETVKKETKKTSTKKEDTKKSTKKTSTKKDEVKKETKKTTTKKSSSKKKDNTIEDVIVNVAGELAEKVGIDKKLVTKTNIKKGEKLLKDISKNSDIVEGALNTIGDLLGKK